MKRFLKPASLALLALGVCAGTVAADSTALPPQPHILYHYDGWGGPLIAISGYTCDGVSYHEPLLYGSYTVEVLLDC